ncbi:MAG: acyl-CoA dehydratase activase [Armatimonadota bacterium]
MAYLGIDVGSVTVNFAWLDGAGDVGGALTEPAHGRPVEAIQRGLRGLESRASKIEAVGVTGSGRRLAEAVAGADVVKNEITAHYLGASRFVPDAGTIIEIGGQDSKIILIDDGVLADFAMNTVCAAGTGSFLDQQAARLNIPIEDFGGLARAARSPVRIAGRCTVFAEADMIHKQQGGAATEDIVAGLCDAIVRNYLHDLGRGKVIRPVVVFQGGVAGNVGVRDAFERALELDVVVPPHHDAVGAIGAAMLAREWREGSEEPTAFKGYDAAEAPTPAAGGGPRRRPRGPA